MQPPEPSGRRRSTALLVVVLVLAVIGATVNVATIGGPLLGAVLTATGTSAPDVPKAAGLAGARTISWGRCPDASLRRLKAQCGHLDVPLDRAFANGTPVRLAVSRIRHTAPRSQGVMIVNPGGPGASGLGTVDVSSSLPASVAGQYDWIGFDPRGVGYSYPSLRCDDHVFDGPRPGYSPTADHIAAWTARARSYASACAGNGDLLQHMTTVDSAWDIEAIRIALGADRINYYGYSYGTYLGQTYATLFPQRVRRMVLDSTEDPRSVDDQYGFGQDRAFEIAMNHYFAWIATWDDVYHLGTTGHVVRQRYAAVRAALGTHPSGAVGSSEWDDVFIAAAYSQSDWPDLTDVFARQALHPDAAALADAYSTYGQGGDNGYATFLAVTCTDGRADRSVPAMLAAVRAEARTAPFTTWADAWNSMPCLFWPARSATTPFRVDGSRTGGVLMIDETLDAATPYSGSLHVRSLFPGARLVAEPGGTSHAQTPSASAPCVLHRIVAYLATGALPARRTGTRADVTCAPAPEPVPNA